MSLHFIMLSIFTKSSTLLASNCKLCRETEINCTCCQQLSKNDDRQLLTELNATVCPQLKHYRSWCHDEWYFSYASTEHLSRSTQWGNLLWYIHKWVLHLLHHRWQQFVALSWCCCQWHPSTGHLPDTQESTISPRHQCKNPCIG